MGKLTIINQSGHLLADSREIAEMIGKRHSDLLESIGNYIKYLENGNFRSHEFFIGDLYTVEGNTREYPMYWLTKKGCDMVANKMTGEKGVLFTAEYVTRFEEMEQILREQQKPTCIEDVLIQSLQEMKDIKHQLNQVNHNALQANRKAEETKEEVQAIREAVEITPSKSWRGETNRLMTKICFKLKDYQRPKEEAYRALEERAGCNLKIRLENMRARQALNGASKSKLDNLNYLDVIAQDKKLIEIYTFIVSQMAIKQGITVKEG